MQGGYDGFEVGHDFSAVGLRGGGGGRAGAVKNWLQSRTTHKRGGGGRASEKVLLKMLRFHHPFITPLIVLSQSFFHIMFSVFSVFIKFTHYRIKNELQCVYKRRRKKTKFTKSS